MKPIKSIEPIKEPVIRNNNYGANWNRAFQDDEWVRDPDTGTWTTAEDLTNKTSTGGEVTNPFAVKEDNNDDKMDDDLPFSLLPPNPVAIIGSPAESGSTKIGNVAFMKNSLPNLALLTESKNSPKFPKNVLCLPGTNSNSTPQSNKRKLSVVSDNTQEKQGCVLTELTQRRRESRPPTSVREVKKVGWFIRDNFKEIEYSLEQFEKNTGGVCCHCKTPIGDLNEVHEFIDKENFVCMSCVTPAKDYVVL